MEVAWELVCRYAASHLDGTATHSNAPRPHREPEGGNASVAQLGSERDVGARCPPSSDGGPPLSRQLPDRGRSAVPRIAEGDTSERENERPGETEFLHSHAGAIGAFNVNSLARCRVFPRYRDAPPAQLHIRSL